MAMPARLSVHLALTEPDDVLTEVPAEEAPFCVLPQDYFTASLRNCDTVQRRVLCEIKRLDGSLLYRLDSSDSESTRLPVAN
jgi:hypothetical protein